LRRGEVLGLRWEDLDLDAGVLEVRRNLQRVGGELRTVVPKTRSSRRTVPLLGLCVEALKDHQQHQTEEAERDGSDWRDTGYVFTTTTRGRLTRNPPGREVGGRLCGSRIG
jgi:integrase